MNSEKRITRYTYDIDEPATPETGHTKLLPSEERNDEIEMDPAYDPQLHWAGKRRRKTVPILPLQRNEIVGESRIAQIIERVHRAAQKKAGLTPLTHFFELEKALRAQDRYRRVEFYKHEEKWRNKLICGDSLLVMESLLYYEGLRGKVQMIYIDPPYGIKYDSNFQQRVDSTENDEKDKADDVLTIKAFLDTWTLGIHSYLSYLQERLYLCRELLADSGSIIVQINDANLPYVMNLLTEVFGRSNFVSLITFKKTAYQDSEYLAGISDYLIWYAKDLSRLEYHQLYVPKEEIESIDLYAFIELPDGSRRRLTSDELEGRVQLPEGSRRYRLISLISQGASEKTERTYSFEGRDYEIPPNTHWKVGKEGLDRLAKTGRIVPSGRSLAWVGYLDDFPVSPLTNLWRDTMTGSFTEPKQYAVQTSTKVLERLILMTSDPGDLIFDPTCGSGTTAICAEKLGRRWITCDVSRVAINKTRIRLLSRIFDHFNARNDRVANGFIYKTVHHVTLKSLAYGLEPEKVELVDQPEIDKCAIRVCSPFEVMTIGRYSVEDWKGYVREGGKLENYIEVICHLYRKDSAIQGVSGFVHAIVEEEKNKIAITVGPLSGRVTAKQLSDAVEDAIASGINEIHVLGWAFEANVGEVKSKLESRGKIKIQLIMIRPDTLAEGLKATSPEKLFSPYALPDIEIDRRQNGTATISLKGVAIFDRKTRVTEYKRADSGYVSAWYLDEDYDGDCFVDCQMFFNFSGRTNIDRQANVSVDKKELRLQLESKPFPIREYKRVAVKVVDVFGNESTVVKEIP